MGGRQIFWPSLQENTLHHFCPLNDHDLNFAFCLTFFVFYIYYIVFINH